MQQADEVFTSGTAVVVCSVGSITYKGQRRQYGEKGQPGVCPSHGRGSCCVGDLLGCIEHDSSELQSRQTRSGAAHRRGDSLHNRRAALILTLCARRASDIGNLRGAHSTAAGACCRRVRLGRADRLIWRLMIALSVDVQIPWTALTGQLCVSESERLFGLSS